MALSYYSDPGNISECRHSLLQLRALLGVVMFRDDIAVTVSFPGL